MAQEVIVTIDPNGSTKVEVKGVKGKGCQALTKEFEESLGKKVAGENTKEFYEPEPKVAVRNRG